MTPVVGPGMTVVFRHRSVNPEAGIDWRHKSGNRPAFFTRAFCRNCNHGWMSVLEQSVEPILAPLLVGLEPHVSRSTLSERSRGGH
jgi:hypothetical protein